MPTNLDRDIDHEKPAVKRILRATLRLLNTRDARQLSMREIAAQARVSKSLLHYHFKSKEDLVLAVVDEFFAGIVRRAEEAARAAHGGLGPEAVLASFDAIWSTLREQHEVQAVIFRLCAQGTLDDGIRQRVLRFRARAHHLLSEGIRHSLGNAIDAGAAAELILACVVGFEANRLFAEDTAGLDRAMVLLRLGLAQMLGSAAC